MSVTDACHTLTVFPDLILRPADHAAQDIFLDKTACSYIIPLQS